MKKLLYAFLLLFVVFISFCAPVVNAEGKTSLFPGTSGIKKSDCDCQSPKGDECKQYCGTYTINEFVGLFYVGYGEFLMTLVGSLSLLMFIAGGLMWILSGGNKTWIDRGRMTLIGAVAGMFVVFLSYTLVHFVFHTVVDEKVYTDDPFISGDDKGIMSD